MDDKNYNIENEIEFINSIIEEAISHGGDRGGAYFSNALNLNEEIVEWLKLRGIDNIYTTTYISKGEKNWIFIAKKLDA